MQKKLRRNFISTMTKKYAGGQEFDDFNLKNTYSVQKSIRDKDRASVDDYRTFDNENKRAVRRKKKHIKDVKDFGSKNDHHVISQAFQVNDKLGNLNAGMSKLSSINNQPQKGRKWQSNPCTIMEGQIVADHSKHQNIRIQEKPIYENFEGSPLSQPEDYEVNFSDGNTGATKETFRVSKKQL